MKRFFIICMLLAAVGITASAYSFKVNNICYNVNSDGKSVAVTYPTSSQPTHTSPSTYSGDVTIPSAVSYSGKTYDVTSIGEYAFFYCSNLTSINIPNTVTNIGYFSFFRCSGLSSITFPNSLTTIGNCAFISCGKLTSIFIPKSTTSIGQSAFTGCYQLKSIGVDSANESFCSIDGVLYSKDSSKLIAFPGGISGEYTIPDFVKVIGDYAFEESQITDLTIRNSVTSIEEGAFSEAELRTVIIGNSVTSIGEYAFSDCNLLNITIGSSVSFIGKDAFPMSSVSNVKCLAKTPPTATGAFSILYTGQSRMLLVPKGCVSSYANATGWKGYFSLIEAIDDEPELPEGDVNHDGTVDVTDVTYLINLILK